MLDLNSLSLTRALSLWTNSLTIAHFISCHYSIRAKWNSFQSGNTCNDDDDDDDDDNNDDDDNDKNDDDEGDAFQTCTQTKIVSRIIFFESNILEGFIKFQFL